MSRKIETIRMSAEDLKSLLFVLKYVTEAEEKSYEEYVFQFVNKLPEKACDNCDVLLDKKFYNRPDIEHIYAIARRVKDVIDSSS
jgi:hypothetical protein